MLPLHTGIEVDRNKDRNVILSNIIRILDYAVILLGDRSELIGYLFIDRTRADALDGNLRILRSEFLLSDLE